MRGRRPKADPRFTVHVSLLTFHGSWKRAENDADGRRSFVAVERSMSDGLLESRKELEPRTRVTSNDHSLQEHRRWSDPQPAVAVARAIDHILFFRF